MGEQTGAGHDGEPRVGKGADHLPSLLDGEELVLLTPHQRDRHGDATVQCCEFVHIVRLKALQDLHGRGSAFGIGGERAQEELVELPVEQRAIHERVAEYEAVAAQRGPTDEPPEQ